MADDSQACEFAPAKINLYLRVLGKRADGYHELDSLVAFADIGDCISFSPTADWALRCEGPFGDALAGDVDNLVLQAARAYADLVADARPGTFLLKKNLPVASGLGGGSADAAATLRLLDRLNAYRGRQLLPQIAENLGSDVPVCLAGRAARLSGRGEAVADVSLPPLAAVLVNPGVAVSTAAVFSALGAPAVSRRSAAQFDSPVDAAGMAALLGLQHNDLEAPALRLAPAIGSCLTALRATGNCMLARMSGSGATVFGLYESRQVAEGEASLLGTQHPDWWVRPATLR